MPLAWLALACIPLGFVGIGGRAGRALAAYAAAAIAVAATGRFPVPVLGHGVAPILGTYLGLGLAIRDRLSAFGPKAGS